MPKNSLTIRASQLKLLESLCHAVAVSGDEGEVRKIVLERLKPHADSLKVDALGNILAVKNGTADNRLRVMMTAHMDEVGFMLTHDEGDGIYRFDTVGHVDPRQLAGKAVWIGREHTPGVIGAKPIHLTTAEERRRMLEVENLRIDVGPEGGKVKVGDRATFATPFRRVGPSLLGKALDNRLGVAILLELIEQSPPNVDLLAVFTVQEEIGGRGARVAAFALDPHLAIAVDTTPARDLPAWDDSPNQAYNTRLGAGAAIYVADAATLYDPRLVRHFAETAQALSIPYQIRQPGSGGTDAGAIHRQRAGIPSLSVSVPVRYLHTAASLARLSDWQNTLALLHAALSRLTPALLASPR